MSTPGIGLDVWGVVVAAAILILIMANKGKAGTTDDPLAKFKSELRQPPPEIETILRGTAQATGVDVHLLKAFAFVESRFNPNAVNNQNPANPSMGLFQIRPVPWVQYLGLGNASLLMDAATNAQAGADILNYFESRGFAMPMAADVYNLGETVYNKGTRNPDYHDKVNAAFVWFQMH